jgi:beta-phosphoglucomutase family hydrolase
MFENYLVIFDMDGVLADTGSIHFESWKKLADKIGVLLTKEFFVETFGQQTFTITRKLVGPEFKDALVEEWGNLKESYYREMVKNKLEPLPGVINLIKSLKNKGFKLAVGSSGPRENVELLLNSLKIDKYFDVVIAAEDVKIGKPAPDVFLIAAKRLNVELKNSIVIEDAPVGIEAAKKANMKTIALTTTHDKEELLNADLIAKDLSTIHLKDILRLFNLESR